MKLSIVFIFFAIIGCAIAKSSKGEIEYTYTLWVGDKPIVQKAQIKLESKNGIHFIDAMNQAAAKSSKFKFEFQQFSFGKFITSIGGNAQDTTNDKYWMIYNMTAKPNVKKPPADSLLSPVGVDELEVVDGRFYLFWLRYVNWH